MIAMEPEEEQELDPELASLVAPNAEPEAFVMPTITRWDVACVGPIVLLSAWAWVSRIFTPSLLEHHFVLLEMLRGTLTAMITAGASVHHGQTPLWEALLAPLAILCAADPFVYWSGRRYGRKILDHLAGTTPKWRRRIAFGERFFRRWGAWTILFNAFLPASGVFFLAAGEVGMSFLLFAAADIAGTMIWIGLVVGLGYTFSDQATQIAATITQYAWFLTGAIIAMAVFTGVQSTRAQMKALAEQNR